MHKRDEVLGLLRRHLPALRKDYGVRSMALFGSVARDAAHPGSDVDVLVDFDRPLGLRFVEFSEYLEGLLGAKADVLTPTGVATMRNREFADRIRESSVRV